MRHLPVRLPSALLGCAVMLAGCAGQRVLPVAELPPTMAPLRPVEPAGLPPASQVPALSADGRYLTPGVAAGAAEAPWMVRAALNVAVLSCRGVDEAAQAAAYNAVLARQKTPLAAAYKAAQAEDRRAFGAKWQAGHDARMTRLYNFYAQPFAKQDFCVAARAVLIRAAIVVPADFPGFAASALPELEAPFVTGYRRFAAYRQDVAAWDAAYGGAPDAAPRLAYAPMETLMAWTPPARGQRVAARR